MRAGNTVPGTWPTLTAELHPGENLLVWSYRSWATAVRPGGEQRWRLLHYEYRRQFGASDSETALDRFTVLMRQLGGHARAPLQYHVPCCPCLGAQEVSVMSLVAACQARQWSLARRIACCLVVADGIGASVAAASAVADLMRRYLPALPLRLSADGDDTVVALHPSGHAAAGARVPGTVTMH